MDLTAEFWNQRYKDNETGWDLGEISEPLRHYFDSLKDRNIKILIPGAGNSYEAEYLLKQGFVNVFVLDWAKLALLNLQQRVPEIDNDHLLHENFFQHQGQYDLIIEQTFFCAIDPGLRMQYALKVSELLIPSGHLVGLLFNEKVENDHPPFGGSKEEYLGYFNDIFIIHKMEAAYNSQPSRKGMEYFIDLEKNK